MCGIAGYVGLDNERLLRAMCDALTHRGPDEDGLYVAPGVGLANRRLSIIDLAGGKQPISNEAGDVWVVFNGEIYNYQDLTRDLAARGHRFATRSDTETLVHGYEEFGLDFVKHLRGMFALALWDAKRRRLVLARDRVGEKPLYVAQRGAELLFASEAKSILQHPAFRTRSVNPRAVCEFLAAGYVSAPRTFFAGISKLAPGEMLVHENGRATLQRYWSVGPARQGVDGSGRVRDVPRFADAVGRLRELLDESVRLCLKSDVEVGAFLSGGIDSSVISVLAAKNGGRLQTFTVGYRGAAGGFNELDYARRVAGIVGSQHHELIIDADSSVEMLPKIIWQYDEPHGEPTSVLVQKLCAFTRERLKCALGGTGGDELFFGYPRHKGVRMLAYYRRLPRFVRRHLVERVIARFPESTRGGRFGKRARRFISGADLPPAEAYLRWVNLFQPDVRAALIAESIREGSDDPAGDAVLRQYLCAEDAGSVLDRAAWLDFEQYLPEYQLCYMDRMSMAVSLEVRSPLCDYRLAEFALGLPDSYRLRWLRSKHILKEAARAWLPSSIIDRKKVGFDSPIGQWIKDELREWVLGFLSPEHVAHSGLLNPAAVQDVLADHLSGRRDYSLHIWSLLALETWFRMYIEDGVTDGRSYQLSDLRGAAATSGASLRGAPQPQDAAAARMGA